MVKRVVGAVCFLVLVVAFVQTQEQTTNALVVMITVTPDNPSERGAGIVFDVDVQAKRIYVVTVEHLVVDDKGANKDFKVEFHSFASDQQNAKVIQNSQQLDLAVLLISPDDQAMIAAIDDIPFSYFSRIDSVSKGDELLKIGYPDGKKWHRTYIPDFVSSTTGLSKTTTRPPGGATVVVQSQTTDPGFSGGVLLDVNDNIVGMIHSSYDRETVATPMEKIKEILVSWGFQPRWQFSNCAISVDGPLPTDPFAIHILVVRESMSIESFTFPVSDIIEYCSGRSFIEFLDKLRSQMLPDVDLSESTVFRMADERKITVHGGMALGEGNTGVLVIPNDVISSNFEGSAHYAFTYIVSILRSQ